MTRVSIVDTFISRWMSQTTKSKEYHWKMKSMIAQCATTTTTIPYTIEPWTSSDRMSESNHTEKCAIFTHDRFMLLKVSLKNVLFFVYLIYNVLLDGLVWLKYYPKRKCSNYYALKKMLWSLFQHTCWILSYLIY